MKHENYVPKGVIPATLLAFNDDYSIDEAATRAHLEFVAGVPGIDAITINGHSSEIHACTPDEQQRLLQLAGESVGDRVPLINGIYSDGSLEAARFARRAEEGGASCLLVFPPATVSWGGMSMRPDAAMAHFSQIADATDLPLILFQYQGEQAYPVDTMVKLVTEIPSIKAVKDWSPPIAHQDNIELLHNLPRPVNVLSTNSAWLMASLGMGCRGLLSGAGSVIADLHVALFNAMQQENHAEAKRLDARIRHTSRVFYADPFGDMHNRMKEALVMLGRMPRAVVRPPLVKISAAEIDVIRNALESAEIAPEGAVRLAA